MPISTKFLFLSALIIFVDFSHACFPGGRMIRRRPRRENPLMYDERVPNTPENSIEAAGRPEKPIRGSTDPRYADLVENYNENIIFKDKDDYPVSRKMSGRCKEKLDTLAMLVSNQWPGLKLRVLKAWIQNRNFAPRLVPNSVLMHYEGRAADLAPSDFDRSKIGALARLAVQAGFDWVHYEHKSHIHASVKSDILSRSTRSLRCFPGSSTVILSNNRTKLLSDVQIGDEIAAFSTSTGRQIFSRVVSFLHVDRQIRIDDYLKIYLLNNYNLTVSPDHLIFVHNNDGSFSTKMAKKLIAGDFLILNNDHRSAVRGKISKIEQQVPSRGLFAPLTLEGTIFVDNVAASCYAGVRSHDLADFVIRPIKYLWPKYDYGRKGGTIHWYANFLWKIADLLESMNIYTFFDDRDL